MSSSINSKQKIKKNQGSKAAIIRPVNRRSGVQTFVRIDTAESAARPKMNPRAMQLEDYVAQIRVTEEAPAVEQKPEPAPKPKPARKAKAAPKAKSVKPIVVKKIVIPVKKKEAPKPEPATAPKNASIVSNIARQQQNASSELTQADHLAVLRTVAKLDAGYEWIADTNRTAATAAAEAKVAEPVETAAPEPVIQTTTQPVSQELINSIATAIASVLTDAPESKLVAKIENGPATPVVPATVASEEETLKLTPELPRPEYTLPVIDNTPSTPVVAKPKPKPAPKVKVKPAPAPKVRVKPAPKPAPAPKVRVKPAIKN